MADGAAHLVDHVLPRAPVRQWVVSYPFAIGSALAFQPELLRAVERLVTRTLQRWQEQRCEKGRSGGVLVRHRFGSSLNIHLHAHLLLLDGAFVGEPGQALTFVRAPKTTPEELRELATDLERQLQRLLARRGLLAQTPAEEQTNELPTLDALGVCAQVALRQGQRERSGAALSLVEEDEVEHPAGGLVATTPSGLHVYASSPIEGNDRDRMERVCRYLLRGPISSCRLAERPDGLLSYRLKKPDRHGNTTLVLTPLELLMRLASLIPGPGHPTRKYFGILAPAAKERALVVPAPTKRRGSACEHRHDEPTPGDTAAPSPKAERLLWAELFRRTWGGDALECSRCKGRLRPIAVLHDPEEIARYLAHTGETTTYARGPPLMAA